MVPLLSKVDLNKLRCDIQNEKTVIYAKFGNDLFIISKVIGRKTKWPRFFWLIRYWKNINKKPSCRQDTSRPYTLQHSNN